MNLCLVIPFYNEEKNIETVVHMLSCSLKDASINYRLVLVNNGSIDNSRQILEQLKKENPERITIVNIEKNQGFGWGIINGLAKAKETYIGYMGGDGQIKAEDVVKVIHKLQTGKFDLTKINRVVRNDGILRKFLSFIFNHLFSALFRVSSTDINGSPKIMRGELLNVIQPVSRDWFIDAEIMIKAKYLNLSIGEVPIEFLHREKGSSHIRFTTIGEFLLNMFNYKFGGGIQEWEKTIPQL